MYPVQVALSPRYYLKDIFLGSLLRVDKASEAHIPKTVEEVGSSLQLPGSSSKDEQKVTSS